MTYSWSAAMAKDSELTLRKVAATLYGVVGCDASKAQIDGARKAVQWYHQGKSIALIRLLLRLKPCPKNFNPFS
jgi:hypothetical protein